MGSVGSREEELRKWGLPGRLEHVVFSQTDGIKTKGGADGLMHWLRRQHQEDAEDSGFVNHDVSLGCAHMGDTVPSMSLQAMQESIEGLHSGKDPVAPWPLQQGTVCFSRCPAGWDAVLILHGPRGPSLP